MQNLIISYKTLIQLVFLFSLFISTGAVVDFLVIGSNDRIINDSSDSQLRLMLWLPVYILFFIFTFKYRILVKQFFHHHKYWLLTLILFIGSSLWAELHGVSLYSSFQLLMISLFAIIVGCSFNLNFVMEQIFRVLSLIVVISFLSVIFLPEYGISTYTGEEAFRGVFIEKNKLGQMLTYYFCFLIVFYKKDLNTILVICMAIFLLLGNKSATALILVTLIPLLFMISKVFHAKRHILLVNSLSLFGLLFITAIFVFSTFEYWLLLLGKDPSLTGRTELWEYGFTAFLEKPLLGYGYNSFWLAEGGLGGLHIRSMILWGPMSMHNSWFEILLQVGILGFLLVLYIFIKIAQSAISLIICTNHSLESRAFFGIVCIYIVWSAVQNVILRHQDFSHFMLLVLYCSVSQGLRLKNFLEPNVK
jgi:O-antigen ligase